MDKDKCAELQKMIRRISGQVKGVERMVVEGRDPIETVHQISAARNALSRLAIEVLKEESRECLTKGKSKKQKKQTFEDLVTNFFKIS